MVRLYPWMDDKIDFNPRFKEINYPERIVDGQFKFNPRFIEINYPKPEAEPKDDRIDFDPRFIRINYPID